MRKMATLFEKYHSDLIRWSFYVFLFSVFFNIRKIIYFIPVDDEFNEFLSASISISDMLFVPFFILSINTVLRPISSVLSRLSTRDFATYPQVSNKIVDNSEKSSAEMLPACLPIWHVEQRVPHIDKKMFHVEHFQLIRKILLFFVSSFLAKIKDILKIVPRGTKSTENWLLPMFHVEQLCPIKKIVRFLKQSYSQIISSIVLRGTISGKSRSQNVPRGTFIIVPIALLLWSALSFTWSKNKILALSHIISLFQAIYLYFFLITLSVGINSAKSHIVPRGTISGQSKLQNVPRGTFFIVAVLSAVNAFIAVVQFMTQKSVGLYWLGESYISANTLNVAKMVVFENKILRTYGLFQHPNILAAFILLGITSLFFIKIAKVDVRSALFCSTWNKMQELCNKFVPRGTFPAYTLAKLFHVEQFRFVIQSSRIARKLNILNSNLGNVPRGTLTDASGTIVPRGTIFFALLTALNILAIFFTGSKAGITAMFIMIAFAVTLISPIRKSLLTLILKDTSIQQRRAMLGILCILTFVCFRGIYQSIDDRVLLFVQGLPVIQSNMFFGTGIGNFVSSLYALSPDIESWRFQPIHNLFLSVFSELGIIGLFLITLFVVTLLQFCINALLRYKHLFIQPEFIFGLLLISFIPFILLDHFFWDIRIGVFIFWMSSGLFAHHLFLSNYR